MTENTLRYLSEFNETNEWLRAVASHRMAERRRKLTPETGGSG